MFIDINTIGPEGLAFDRSIHLRNLEGPSRERIGEVEARFIGSVVPAGAGAELKGSVTATVPLQCSRCLESFLWTVNTHVELAVSRTELEAGGATDEDAASILVAPEGKLGLEDVATEQLYLNLPLKPVCVAACQGLCPSCGTNRNLTQCSCQTDVLDPRLAPLLRFRKKITGSERS